MMQFQVWILLLFLADGYFVLGGKEPNYMVVVPSIMRPGRNFDASIQFFNVGPKATTKVTAEILKANGNVIASSDSTKSPPIKGSQGKVSVKVPLNVPDRVTYRIKGVGAVDFMNETEVKVSFKTVTILIQTDKAIYKPGQTVKFRCMAVYSDLKPYKGKFNIDIFDINDNKMRQWNNVKDASGVFDSEYPLAAAPPLGDWKIVVEVDSGESASKEFLVDEFVLPKIEAKLQVPSFYHISMNFLVATVSAQYTYGKPISGKGSVTIKSTSNRYNPSTYPPLTRKITLVNGKKDVKFSRDDLRQLYKCTSSFCGSRDPLESLRGKTLNITAMLEDDVSGEEMFLEKTVRFESQLHKIKFLENTPETFRDGLRWIGFVQLTLQDGSPPTTAEGKDIQVHFNFQEIRVPDGRRFTQTLRTIPISKNFTVTSSGIIKIDVNVPKGMTDCHIRATFKSDPSSISTFKSIETFVSRAKQGLQISIDGLEGVVEPGKNVKFVVKTTEQIDHFYYQILSKGRIVLCGNEEASGKRNMFSVKFNKTLAQKTAPSARIIVWYLTDDVEVIVDSVEFNVKGAFVNDVTVEFSDKEVKPGDKVDVIVNAHKNSFVGLLAVDQSVLLLKGGNDITQEDVLGDLQKYDSSEAQGGSIGRPFIDKKRRRKRSIFCRYCYFPRSSGGKDAKELFENAGVKVLTDAYVHEEEEVPVMPRPTRPVFAVPRAGGARARGSFPAGGFPRRVLTTTRRLPLPSTTQPPAEFEEPENLREIFPETWIWEDTVTGKNGQARMTFDVPDTITSWIASAFAMNDDVGLGIADETAKLIVFKAFFAQIDLPFSAIRGELLELKVLVFNFLNTKQKVTVTLEKPPNGEFFARGPDDNKANKAQQLIQTITIEPGDGVNLAFWIKPVKVGQVPVQVKARSTQAADALKKMLLVEPEGEPQVYTKSFYIELEDGTSFSEKVDILFPADVVPDSQRVLFSAIGDIMGPTMRNLDQLLKMPYGCGEQNMLNFAPNIFILEYLTAIGGLNSEIKDKAEKFMIQGYSNELRFQRKDGSFSAFGNSDRAGSMWLTAFVIWSFDRAKPFTTIEQKVIDDGLRWILRNKGSDGSFAEPPGGKTLHTDMQGGASQGTPLTAYVLITLIKLKGSVTDTDMGLRNDLNAAISKSTNHIVSLLDTVKKDVYAMALITYALTLLVHAKKNVAYNHFNALATVEGGSKFWKRDDKEIVIQYGWRPPYRPKPSNSIEMTAYGVLINLERNDMAEAATIIRWLAAQRNSFGGYSSTQDTVVGIDALAQFAKRASSNANQDVLVSISDDMQTRKFKPITKKNFDILQQIEVEDPKTKMTVKATGKGVALVQLSVFYNKKEQKDKRGYTLIITPRYISPGRLETKICFRYTVENIPSGMVVIEMNQLTGHIPDTSLIMSMNAGKGLKKFEFLNNKKLALYLDEVTNQEICITIISLVQQNVENLQHALCMIYSYYKTEVADSKLYLPGSAPKPSDCPKLSKKDKKKARKFKPTVCKKPGKGCIKGSCAKIAKKSKDLLKKVCDTDDGKKYCCQICKKNGF